MLAEGFNIVAYVIPFFILVVGLGIVAIVITRLKQGIREPAKTTSAKTDRAQFDYQQIEDEVERYKRD